MKYKVLSVVISVCLLFNFCGIFSVQASANPIIIGLLDMVASVVKGALIGAGMTVSQGMHDSNNALLVQARCESIDSADNFVDVYYDGNNITFVASENLTGGDLEIGNRIANRLNSDQVVKDFIMDEFTTESMSASLYKYLKNQVIDEFNAYLTEAYLNDPEAGVYYNPITALPFDFVGPIQQFAFPDTTNESMFSTSNYVLLQSWHTNENNNFSTRAIAESVFAEDYCFGSENGFYGSVSVNANCYKCGVYIVYNGDIFYETLRNYSSYTYVAVLSWNDFYYVSRGYPYTEWFVNKDGVSLRQAGLTTFSNLVSGVFYTLSPDIVTPAAAPDDLTTTTPGATVSAPRSHWEELVGQAELLDLISKNPALTIDANGNITSADGISMEDLERLVGALAEQQVKFSDFQSYLEAIKIACEGTNLSSAQIAALLQSISANMVKESDLSNINDYLASISAALSQTATAELDIDVPDLEYDAFIAEHTGLAEATVIVSGLPIVNQVSGLISNLLDPNKYDSSAPNFRFTWDSNGDGVSETYTALDLSFLDTSLTNENLSDKERFKSPMTIRQFIQFLIILICYVCFAIKILKKLPSLFGGSEGSNDMNTFDK